jgi:2-polyprenyl-3-methyl-5-hydroxy-6-metoxy-1,4-benzoquinol methylase
MKELDSFPGDYQQRALKSGHPLQRAWHRSRVQFFLQHFDLKAEDTVVDVGCGSGIFLSEIAPKVKSAIGIDGSSEVVRYGQKHFSSQKNVSIQQGSLGSTGLPPSTASVLLCAEVLEHLHDDEIPAILAHFHSLLKKGGRLFLTSPNERSLWPLMEWVLDHSKIIPKMADDQHVSHWTQAKFKRLLSEAGFSEVRTGTFNLISPLVTALAGAGTGRVATRLESSFLKLGGPLVWATARK